MNPVATHHIYTRAAQRIMLALAAAVAIGIKAIAQFRPFPSIVPDEFTYMTQAYFGTDLGLGNFLFNLTSGASLLCDSNWYGCIKATNLTFETLASILIASWAYRQTKKAWVALLAFSLMLFGPFMLFGSHFMPDSLFALGFVILFIATSAEWKNLWWGILGIGFAMGLLLLIKPHALAAVMGLLALAFLHLFLSKDKSSNRLTMLVLGAFLGVVIRLGVGFALYGSDGLRLLADYASSGSGSLLAASTTGLALDFNGASLSFGTNILVGLSVVVGSLAAASVFTGRSTRSILSHFEVWTSGLLLFSFVILASVFGAYLELVDAEATAFRALTRYWEFAAGVLIVTLITAAMKESKHEMSSSRERLWLSVVSLILACLVWAIPQTQYFSDSSFLTVSNAMLVIINAPILLAAFARLGKSIWVKKTALLLISLAGFAPLSAMAYRAGDEPAGVAAGQALVESIRLHPEDVDRIVFVGERTAAYTAAFTAKLRDIEYLGAGYYSSVSSAQLPISSPRWVVVGKEVFLTGPSVQFQQLGDGGIYEVSPPAKLYPWELERFGYKIHGKISSTYWGGWLESEKLTIEVPDTATGNTLRLYLLVNDELSDTLIGLDFGEGPVYGNLEPNQVIAPIDLVSKSGSWAGKTVEIWYAGDQQAVKSSVKRRALGIGGLSILQGD